MPFPSVAHPACPCGPPGDPLSRLFFPPTSVATFSRLCLPRAFFLPWAFEHTHPSSGCVFPPCPPVTLSPPVTFAVLWDTGHCYLPFRYQIGQVTCPRSHSRCALGLGFDPPPGHLCPQTSSSLDLTPPLGTCPSVNTLPTVVSLPSDPGDSSEANFSLK